MDRTGAALMSAVIDASFVASLILPDEHNKKSEEMLLLASQSDILAPALWPFEVANLLIFAQRRKRISSALLPKLSDAIDALPVMVESPLTSRQRRDVIALANEQDLTAYDSAYLELAMRSGSSLLTLDTKLKRAAKIVGVEAL
jgi:predicted nucleic acid-binding protein